ncbi:hypothetical protein IZ6_25230 [Terrihabitans soli]|uniref:Uncharacterized protein n=1 Tax=Terrihabitans soli TaxID=708113 RepID=A0A6S6QYW0_9HYPH|nr:hypothetical protein [Terrihabitans soli]BCJ91788.1 hypothetical protein IZ6_25230 [Terrihabitans soli]
MKQIAKTAEIIAKLKAAVGDDVNVDDVVVFEAAAFNTLPIRKRHTLFLNAQAERNLLVEMAAALAAESRPVQIMHNTEVLPVGRVFHGEVIDRGDYSELRTLFFVDPTHADLIGQIERGTVDQVSVSILSKKLLSSASGFDFYGPDATFEHLWTGTDPDGNKLGQDGVFARLVGLSEFFEMSLVHRGGAQKAKIVSREQSHFGSANFQRLAASGLDPNVLVLTAVAEGSPTVDFEKLMTQLTDKTSKLALSQAEATSANAQIETLTAELADVRTKLEAATADDVAAKLTEANATIESTQADLTAATEALKGVAQKVLTASGKVDAEVPADIQGIVSLITETTEGLAAALVAGGRAKPADSLKTPDTPKGVSAFRTNRPR